MADGQQVLKSELKSKDFVPRGNKSPSPFNTTLYLSMRAIDCYWQYMVLSRSCGSSLIEYLGGTVIPTPPPLITGIPLVDKLGLSGFRLALLAMNVAACLKHFWFVLRVAEEAWTFAGAVVVGLDNIFFDTLNNFLFLWATASAASGPAGETLAGLALFAVGIGAECVCEVDRKLFKSDPRNKGKPFTNRFFAVVRHPNYTAFTVWRAGLAVATSGATWGLAIAGFFLWDFSFRAVPALDEYCTKRVSLPASHDAGRLPVNLLPLWNSVADQGQPTGSMGTCGPSIKRGLLSLWFRSRFRWPWERAV